jgi:phosphohistidine phosphatase
MSENKKKSESGKTLFIVRHAKSSWDREVASDFDRPLNDRGKHDAPKMAEKIYAKGHLIDAFVSSPALRALSTAEFFSDAWQIGRKKIKLVPELYHASPETLLRVVEALDDSWQHVAFFSHNPGITEFVNQLVENTKLDNMPTCGVFAVTAPIDHWRDFGSAKKSLLFFYRPTRE